MAAYATHQRELLARDHSSSSNRLELALAKAISGEASRSTRGGTGAAMTEPSILDQLSDHIADRLAAVVTARIVMRDDRPDEWFDSRHAAEYLGVHRDTLRKLAAERAIPSEQAGPDCKLYFRRSDLDAWRQGGGRPRHLASTLAAAA